MNRSKLALPWLFLGIATACASGCSSRHEDRPSSTGASGDTADFAQTRDRVVRQIQDRLAELDVKLASLKSDAQARSGQLSSEGKAALADAIAKLEEQRAAAQVALEQTRSGTAERWEQVKHRADQALLRIDAAYEAAAKKLRE